MNTFDFEKYQGYARYHVALNYLYCAATDGKAALWEAYMRELIHVEKLDIPETLWPDVFHLHKALFLPNYVTPVNRCRIPEDAISKLDDNEVSKLVLLIRNTHEKLENIYRADLQQ